MASTLISGLVTKTTCQSRSGSLRAAFSVLSFVLSLAFQTAHNIVEWTVLNLIFLSTIVVTLFPLGIVFDKQRTTWIQKLLNFYHKGKQMLLMIAGRAFRFHFVEQLQKTVLFFQINRKELNSCHGKLLIKHEIKGFCERGAFHRRGLIVYCDNLWCFSAWDQARTDFQRKCVCVLFISVVKNTGTAFCDRVECSFCVFQKKRNFWLPADPVRLWTTLGRCIAVLHGNTPTWHLQRILPFQSVSEMSLPRMAVSTHV